MTIFEPTTLQLVTMDTYKQYARRSLLVKEYNRKNSIDHITQWPSLVRYRVNVGRDQWVTSGFLLARYGPFNLFTTIASEVFTRPVSSDGYDLLFALASSENTAALGRLLYFFNAFTMYDINKRDQFDRSLLHYVCQKNVFSYLIQKGCSNNNNNSLGPFQYMAVMGNNLFFRLTKDFDPILEAIAEHGTTSPFPFLNAICKNNPPPRSCQQTICSIIVYLGSLHLFTEKAFHVFEHANRHVGGNVPLPNNNEDERELYNYCYEVLKTRQPGLGHLVLGSLRRRLLGGGPVTNEFRHFAYMKLVRLILCEAPLNRYDWEYSRALCRNVATHCLLCGEEERLDIAKLMVETEVPDLMLRLNWITEWICTAYEVAADRESYMPIIYKLAKIVDEDGQTVLHKLCDGYGTFEFFKTVVDMGVDLDARDCDGSTALLLLLQSRREEQMQMIKLLLDSGAHVDIPDAKRKVATEKILCSVLKVNRVLPLQCLCAKVLQQQGDKKVLRTLPEHIKKFVLQH